MTTARTSTPKLSVAAVTIAALTAVAFWSLKPVFISIIGDRGDFAEVYVVAAVISLLASAAGALVLWRKTMAIARGGRQSLSGAASAALSGVFLALWYYGFYRALYGAPKVDATIIAFTWPLIAVVAMRVFSPTTARKLRWNEWLMVLASFVGAAAIGVSNAGVAHSTTDSSGEIIWAFVAAVGSGLYLPFAINATRSFDRLVDSRPIATFYAISVANATALVIVLVALQITGHTLRFYAFDPQVLLVCALIGIGTYLVAEITWTWAFQEYKSLTLSSLPYFSPAVSVVLLYLLFDEPVRPIAIVGLVLILFSNLTLHARHRSMNALSLSLVATVYVALASQVLPRNVLSSVPEMAAAITGLFAILAGFTLAQVAGRRTQELDARATVVRRLIATDATPGKDEADVLLQDLIELEYDSTAEGKENRALRIKRSLAGSDGTRTPAQESAMDAFNGWLAIHLDRLSLGERAALWLTGLGSIVFVLLLRGDSPLGNAGAILFAGGAFLAMFAIRDYDRNNIHGFTSQIWRLEQGFREIGKRYYLPAEILDSGEFSAAQVRDGIRTRNDGEPIRLVKSLPPGRGFNAFYLGTAALVILAIVLMPTAFNGEIGTVSASSPRPGEIQELPDTGQATVTIADPGWPGAGVAAAVLAGVLGSADVTVEIEQVDHVDAVAGIGRENPAIQVHPDLWLQNQGVAVREWVASGAIQLSEHSYSGTQGVYVLDAAGSRDALTKAEDLFDPDVAELFDSDGDGVGEMWIGPRGWASTENLDAWLEASGNESIEGESYSETIFKARLEQEVASGRPLLFYGYEPDGIHEQYTLRRLASIPWASGQGDENVDVHVAWASSLDRTSPAAARVLRDVEFTEDDVSAFIAAVDLDGRDPQEVAEQWLAENADRVAQWGRAGD
ncbi:glycine betaine ABC transporter substrate-binding protein [Promicromonospora panici]|uniref:glycine betaine ABC transporter substrate-binding protein n=1 Tax=Promicromonospora panici TaxID=2219658 RepID=UPI00101BBBBE|nr:glycine betaine ABC transporter substrate-binding protein [Promicromonospora panici]